MDRRASRADPTPPSGAPADEGSHEDARSAGELAQAAVAGARWITIARVGAEVLLFLTMVALARLIPPSEFGKFAIALFMQELAIGVLGEGIGSALVQRRSVRREHLQAGLVLALGLETGLAIVTLFVFAPLIFAPLFGASTAGLVQLSTPIFVLTALGTVPQAVLQRRLDFRRLGLIQLAAVLVRSLTSVALALFAGLGASALVLGAVAAAAVGTGLALACAPVPPPRLRRRAVRELAGYGVPASIAAISWAGFRNVDYAIVGARLGAASAGLYWRAFQLAVEYQKKISVVMYQVAFPILSRAESVEDMFILRLRMVRLLTVILFPCLAALVVLAPVLIPWMLGPSWESAVVPTQILVVAGAATLVIDAVGATLMAAGRPRALLGYGWAHFATYAGVILIVAPLGLRAVSFAAAGVHVVFLLIAYGVLLRDYVEHPLRRLWSDIAPASVSCLALLAVAVPIAWALTSVSVAAPAELAVTAAAAAAAYSLALRTVFPASWRDLTLLIGALLPARVRHRRLSLAGAPQAG